MSLSMILTLPSIAQAGHRQHMAPLPSGAGLDSVTQTFHHLIIWECLVSFSQPIFQTDHGDYILNYKFVTVGYIPSDENADLTTTETLLFDGPLAAGFEQLIAGAAVVSMKQTPVGSQESLPHSYHE